MSKSRAYIDKYGASAVEAAKGTRLFPSLMIAQGILESRNGDSTLARQYNNHFGIKADKSWKGPVALMDTAEYKNGEKYFIKAPFRAYANAVEGFADRINFLKKNPRYKKVFEAQTPEQQADALQAAGYATDPNYAKHLKELIRLMNLKTLDNAAAPQEQKPAAKQQQQPEKKSPLT